MTTEASTRPPTEVLFDRLDEMVRRGDRARMAAIRQLTAPPERWRPEAYAVGLPLLPPSLHPREECLWLSVCGLHSLWHQGRRSPCPRTGRNFGASMALLDAKISRSPRAADTRSVSAVERRFSVLLTSDQERLNHHLRQAVSQLASAEVDVDFSRLLDDLRHWEHPDRYVQRRWARQFWAPAGPLEPNKERQ